VTSPGLRVVGAHGVTEEERMARVALNTLGEPGDPRFARLVEQLGPVELHERLRADLGLSGLRSDTAGRLEGLDPRRILEEAAAIGARFVVPGDPEWPEQLADLAHVEPLNRLTGAPLGLWVTGPLDLAVACRRSLAVVGSRSATSYGAEVARDLAHEVGEAGRTVVSGAAFGIDVAAHRGALSCEGGRTVAVLACGVDRAYPPGHRELLRHLKENGAVVSELPPGCAPTRVRFLSRNRLIAALTQGTVVVEAAVRSGALNTAGWAMRLNRPVMAVPGPVTSAPSEGVHELVRSGAATLVTRAAHVLELVSPMGVRVSEPARDEPTARDRLGPTELRVLEAVPLVQPAGAAAIARTSGLSVASVVESLVRLRELGWVVGAAGRWRRSPDEPLS
jgi:DNA processing protein